MAEEVDVLGRSVQFSRPDAKEHGAFEYEPRRLGRPGKPGDQSFDGVLRQNRVEICFVLAGDGQQTTMHRGGITGQLRG